MRRLALVLALVAGAIVAGPTAPAAALPPIGHVFTIVLENENFDTTFGAASKAPYLARELPAQGQLLTQYYGIGHFSLDNYLAMISGQGPNPATQADCPFYMDLLPGVGGADGQASGVGCVYPSAVPTVAGQLQGRGLTWRGYMEDMANSTTQSHECRHPALNSLDSTQSAKAGDQYAARHDPFVYFHSIIDDAGNCADHVVALGRLASDLRSAASTPNYTFISPNLCHDGHDAPCVDGQPGGLVSADQFLRTWVPQILASPAYQADGLVQIIFDESASGSESCCAQKAANTPSAGGPSPGPGGGRVGAVLLSRYIVAGSTNSTPYNHYSMLRSVQDIFGLAHLGYAGVEGLKPYGQDVFGARAGGGPAPAPQTAGAVCSTTRVRGRRGGRGLLIGAAQILRARGRALLALTAAHGARLTVTERSGRRTLRVASRRVRACRSYRFALPKPHGRVTVTARLPHHRERRVLGT